MASEGRTRMTMILVALIQTMLGAQVAYFRMRFLAPVILSAESRGKLRKLIVKTQF